MLREVLTCTSYMKHSYFSIEWTSKGTIYIMGEFSTERPNFKFTIEKTDDISDIDVKAFLAAYKEANRPNSYISYKKKQATAEQKNSKSSSPLSWLDNTEKDKAEAYKKLEEMGVSIFHPDSRSNNLDWVSMLYNYSGLIIIVQDYLAGYEKQKRDIEDTVMLALTYPEIYDEITQGTRMKVEPNKYVHTFFFLQSITFLTLDLKQFCLKDLQAQERLQAQRLLLSK